MAWFQHGNSRIYYEEQGSGDPVLVIPGVTMGIEDMAPMREALAQRYRVIAADAPGSGQSGPQPRDYPATYYDDDARSFLALLQELAAKPAHLVGFSDGGEYALVMAQLDPSAVRSIAAWGAAGQLAASTEIAEAFGQLIDNPAPPMAEYANYLKGKYGEANARIMTASVGKAWQEIIDAGGDISRKRAGEIACPALLITGEGDFLAPPAIVSDMANAMPRAEYVEAKGAGHAVHHDQPEWLVKTVVEWLGRR